MDIQDKYDLSLLSAGAMLVIVFWTAHIHLVMPIFTLVFTMIILDKTSSYKKQLNEE